MEIFKNFVAGLLVLLLAFMIVILSLVLFPVMIIAGSLIVISFKVIAFIAACVLVIIFIGYLARKGFRGKF